MFRRRQRAAAPAAPAPAESVGFILDQYVRSAPSAQVAIDLFAGEWSSRFPDSTGLTAGPVPLFTDPRVTWTIEQAGGVDGKRVLELGPLEAGHTFMLHEAGASVVAVESNSRAYLKCLIVKEVLGLHRSSFLLGDFVPYLHDTDEQFDLVLASGVLYHSPDPLGLLESIARVGARVAIWTHYYEPDVVATDPGKARMFVPEVEEVSWRGHTITLHRRNYLESLQWAGFCGGPESSALWMERDGLMTALRELGYSRIEVQSDDLENPNGACVMLFAER
jgi:SAM-dependent methyltransferase